MVVHHFLCEFQMFFLCPEQHLLALFAILIILTIHIIIAVRRMLIKILSAVIKGREWLKVIVPGFVTLL
jgi:hypothetical protein